MKKLLSGVLFTFALTCISQNVSAAPLSVFDSTWTNFTDANEEDITTASFVNPGIGGQQFDAEYLFYRVIGNYLYLGLQTGFDLIKGYVDYSGTRYYAGDLALSFGNDGSTYNYVVDFGTNPGTDTGDEKLYKNPLWSNPQKNFFSESAPYERKSGTEMAALGLKDITNGIGISDTYNVTEIDYSNCTKYKNGKCKEYGTKTVTKSLTSYYTIAQLDLTDILGDNWTLDGLTFGAHWTMSCGNDEIFGTAKIDPVPEPATMLLFGSGLIGFAGIARRRIHS